MTLKRTVLGWFGQRGSSEPVYDVGSTPAAAHAHRPIEAWIEARTGKPVAAVTTRDLLQLPREQRLRYAPLVSELGGRLDRHLLHLDPAEARELRERGDAFLEASHDTDDHDR